MNAEQNKILSEIFFTIIGILIICNGVKALQDTNCKKRITTAIFWFIMGLTFILGPHIPYWITGVGICIVAVLTATNNVVKTKSDVPTAEETRANANRIGYKIFIPALCLALVSVLVAALGLVSSNNAIGVSAVVGAVVVLLLTKTKPKNYVTEGNRLLDSMGTVVFLPQLLAALGALFTACGVGDVIAKGVSVIIPEGNIFIAVAVYCVGMALFTAIMGNGFAAFSVITVGIAMPFLFVHGPNAAVIGAMGLTAGYCGTLCTPMAANFNIMPAAVLEMKNKYGIIKQQAPVAVAMLIIHIVLMYFLAF